MGVALAGAMDLGRVLIFDKPDPNVYLSDQYCEGARSWDECYFIPISNCSASASRPRSADTNTLSLVKRHQLGLSLPDLGFRV